MEKYYYYELNSDCYLLSKKNDNLQCTIFASFENMGKYVIENNGILLKGDKA